MRIHDPKRFGTHLMVLRKTAGITLDEACRRMEMDKKIYAAIESGNLGTELDDDLIDALMDWLPGFSPGSSPGVSGPPVRKVDLERDGPPVLSDRERILGRQMSAPPPTAVPEYKDHKGR